MSETVLFLGCLLLVALFAALVGRYRTVLFGLNGLNLFTVASASLSGLFVSVLFGGSRDWISPEHVEVFEYSLAGLMAMIVGIFLAWRPLAQGGGDSTPAQRWGPHLNAEFGWATFVAGLVFELLYPFLRDVPTVSTALSTLSTLSRVGLLMLLWAALETRRWRRFGVAMVLFMIVSIMVSLASGFSFIRINTLIPLILVAFFFRGLSAKSLIAIPVGAAIMAVSVSAWLGTRDVIRSGELSGSSGWERAEHFFSRYLPALGDVRLETVHDAVFDRVDMSTLLAWQVAHQPQVEPYAYGETVSSSLYTLIPRALWPDKPEVAGGTEFFTRFTGAIQTGTDETSIGLPYQFELYANAGPWGVIIGLGVLGYVLGVLERRMSQPQRSVGGFWALAAATAMLCEGGQRTDVVLPAIVAAVICCYFAGWMLEKYWPELAARLLHGRGADAISGDWRFTGRGRGFHQR